MAFFSDRNNIFSSSGERLKRSKRLGKEQLQYLVKELGKDLEQGETLLQSLPMGIILLNKDFCLQLMNRAARRCPLFFLHQVHQVNAFYDTRYPIWHDLSHEELSRWLESELQGKGVSRPREFNYFDDNGELRVILIEISSQVRDGAIEGWIILITDVSELRQQEREVRQLAILASLSTVTAGVAHEIKNPLAAMSLHVQLMQRLLRRTRQAGEGTKSADPISGPPQEQLLEYCGIVQEEIERLNTFVTDFLLTVRPLELELIGQDIRKVVQPCIDLLQPELEDKGIVLELKLREGLPNVALDESMFRRMLLNLLQNAIQAIEDKTETLNKQMRDLYRGHLGLQSYQKSDKVYLEITDNGCGMSDETQKKILEPFFTTRPKGSGLGMTMVLRILQTHNGDLQIQTKEGVGTVLRIALPLFHQEQKLLIDRNSLYS
ncbi:ATP-binding protein [Candidatus Haliotispira prima]|uniref:histidine kinase n=1 Tax=Candidatus Haliotispira prima TaxID=3034016 RepID=A0ABY8MN12_9SPIO|nr:ATP-binding protein [Candidatus Haliotispira prima]